VEVYLTDAGAKWVKAADPQERYPKGASFFSLAPSQAASQHHPELPGPCSLISQAAVLPASKFELRPTWPLLSTDSLDRHCPIRTSPDPETPVQYGEHYALVPLVDMPLEDYIAEVDRLTSLGGPCQRAASAAHDIGGECWPPDHLLTSTRLTSYAAIALRTLSESADEDDNARAVASLAAVTICAGNMNDMQLLQNESLSAVALVAATKYEEQFGAGQHNDWQGALACEELALEIQQRFCPDKPGRPSNSLRMSGSLEPTACW
jgi:hypothetical protein